jgi:hypothetical protein
MTEKVCECNAGVNIPLERHVQATARVKSIVRETLRLLATGWFGWFPIFVTPVSRRVQVSY